MLHVETVVEANSPGLQEGPQPGAALQETSTTGRTSNACYTTVGNFNQLTLDRPM